MPNVADLIIGFVVGLLRAVFALIPNWSLPVTVPDVFASLAAYAGMLNGFFPVTTLGACILAVMALRAALLIWAGLVFIYDRFPFKFT